LNNKRCKANRYFRKKTAYLEAKIEKLESNSKIENIRDFYSGSMILRRVTREELI